MTFEAELNKLINRYNSIENISPQQKNLLSYINGSLNVFNEIFKEEKIKKINIDVDDMLKLKSDIREFNKLNLKDIEFIYNNKLININQKVLEEWKFIGLSNIDFMEHFDWEKEELIYIEGGN